MSKRYKVVGSAPILDHKPGETFEADLDETNESYFIGIGGIVRVEKPVEEKVKRLNVESYKSSHEVRADHRRKALEGLGGNDDADRR